VCDAAQGGRQPDRGFSDVTTSPDERARLSTEHPYWRRNARVLATGNLLVNTGWNAAFAFLPLIVQAMGVEHRLELWVGAMMFGYYMTSCLSTPVWGVLADYYGRKSMVLRAGFGMAVGFAILSMTSDPLAFLCLLVLIGLANGYVPAGQALIATATPGQHIGGALALSQAGAVIGTLLGPLAGAALIGLVPGGSVLFAFTAALMFAASTLALTSVREDHVRPAHAFRIDLRGDVRRVSTVRGLKLLYYVQVLFAFTVFGSMAIVSMYTIELLADRPGFGGLGVETWVAITAIAFTVGGVAILPLWAWALERHPPERMLALILAGTAATSLLQPLVRDPLELTLARILFALFISGLPPTLIRMIKERAPQGMEARTLSYGTALQQMGSASAPLIAGLLAPYLGLRGFFWLCSALIVVGWILWARHSRRVPSVSR
jgi:DHA1 family multidrug resistance protein-like MFS transporter